MLKNNNKENAGGNRQTHSPQKQVGTQSITLCDTQVFKSFSKILGNFLDNSFNFGKFPKNCPDFLINRQNISDFYCKSLLNATSESCLGYSRGGEIGSRARLKSEWVPNYPCGFEFHENGQRIPPSAPNVVDGSELVVSSNSKLRTMNYKLLTSKRAVAPWISWVLLVGLAVVLGAFMLSWARDMARDSSTDLKERADTSTLCSSLGLRIDSLCQNTQTLNMNVTNNNNANIKSVMVLMVDIYDSPQLRETNTTIKPEEKKELKIVKQGVVKRVEVTPATFSGSKRIVCHEKKVTTETIPIC